jgi:hypothetical protein
MLKIGLVYIKKHGGFPFTGGGFQAMTFLKHDIDFISKIVNELDMSNNEYRYALTVISQPYDEDKTIDKIEQYKERAKMIRVLYKKLLNSGINKDIVFDGYYINLTHKEVDI